MKFSSPLGDDALLLIGFHGREAVSELYAFELDLVAPRGEEISFDKILGQSAAVESHLPETPRRYFRGMISRMAQVGRDEEFVLYRARLVPKLWALSQNKRSRVFQQQTVPQILDKVFEGYRVKFTLHDHYPKHNYCVQSQESDFAFASRLMEEEGIHFRFDQQEDGEELVICDDSRESPLLPDQGELRYDATFQAEGKLGLVGDWIKSQELVPGKVKLGDYSFELPSQDVGAQESLTESVTAGSVRHSLPLGALKETEVYDYPGSYSHRHDGVLPTGEESSEELHEIFEDRGRTARIRMEERAAGAVVIEGTSTASHMTPGFGFHLAGHFDGDGAYFITEVEHQVELASFRGDDRGVSHYKNTFRAVPRSVRFRPERETPIPTMKGSQTAKVVGPAGTEVFTDKYGRIHVSFHWGEVEDESSHSCWLRVSQPWAGQGWGMVALPRVGQEVVVDFLDGDPDQPIVTGSVYNAEQPVPYKLPDERSQMGIRSRSRHGDAENYSEFRIDDTLGKEQLHFHAERDLTTSVENDHSTVVANDMHVSTGADKHEAIAGVYNMIIGGGTSGDASDDGSGASPPSTTTSTASQGSGSGGDSSYWGPGWNYQSPYVTRTIGYYNSTYCLGEMHTICAGNNLAINLAFNETVNVGWTLNLFTVLTTELFFGAQFEIRRPLTTEIKGGESNISFLINKFKEQEEEVAAVSHDIAAAADLAIGAAGAVDLTAGAAMMIDAGATLDISSTGIITIMGTAITLSAGPTNIAITPAGIILNGPIISLNADTELSMMGVSLSEDMVQMNAAIALSLIE
ncbi:type VI secretion system Vgr family protein [Kolteria novifilia]